MDSINIIYDGQDAFYPQPTPYVGINYRNIYYGELWAKAEQLILQGQLTGCDFDSLYSGQQKLLSSFAKNYQLLQIWQYESGYSGIIFEKNFIEIESIRFDTTKYIGIIPYTITLSCYPSGLFSGVFGVLDPLDSWSFKENENYTSQIIHTISCRGINTSSTINNALDNAKNWALNKRGIDSLQSPILIENISSANMCLITSNEEINRINGTYSIVDTYISDLARTGYGLLRYSTSFESGNELVTTTLNGTVRGCGQDINSVRQTFQLFDKTSAASISYQKMFNRNDLNPTPLYYNIEEDPLIPLITFNYIFDNDDSPPTVFDYQVRLSSGSNITASINGNIISRGGDLLNKIVRSKNYASQLNLYNLTVPFYNNFYPYNTTYPLNPKPISSGISINEFNGEVSINAEFNNQVFVSDSLQSFNYIMSFQPQIKRIDSKPTLLSSSYSTVDLGFAPRAIFGINGNSVIATTSTVENGINEIKNKCQLLLATYAKFSNIALENEEINVSRYDEKIITFNFAWSFDSDTINPNYSTLTTLNI